MLHRGGIDVRIRWLNSNIRVQFTSLKEIWITQRINTWVKSSYTTWPSSSQNGKWTHKYLQWHIDEISKNEVITHHGDWFEATVSSKNPHGIMTTHRILAPLVFSSFLYKYSLLCFSPFPDFPTALYLFSEHFELNIRWCALIISGHTSNIKDLVKLTCVKMSFKKKSKERE